MLPEEYERVYPINQEVEPSGGYVEIHPLHGGVERIKNIQTSIFLAKLGYKVQLLPIHNIPNHKNPDAFLIDENIVIEFKHNEVPTKGAIENEIRKAKDQSDNILIHVLSDISKKIFLEGIKHRYRRKEPDYQKLNNLWIIWKNQLYKFSREEIIKGTIDYKIQ